MKTVLKLGWILGFSLITFLAFSKDYPDLQLKSYYGKSFILQIPSSEMNTFQITLKDLNDAILMNDVINKKGPVKRKYNLANLPQGEYFLFIEGNQKVQIQPIRVKENKVEIDRKLSKYVFKPYFTHQEGFVDFTMLKTNKEKANLLITDEDGDELLKDELEATGNFTKRFDITQLQRGAYDFEIKTNGLVFKYQIEIP